MQPQPTNGFLATRWPHVLLGVVAVAALLGYGNTLGGYFVGDDFGYVGRFAAMPLAEWPRLFVREWSGGMWGFQLKELRPVTALTFIGDGHLWGGAALGFRLTNLCLHIACAWLVGAIAWRVTGEAFCALVAGLLFALHPVHVEPVVWITGRVDLVATFFYLAGIVAWLAYRAGGGRRWLVAAWVSYALAAFSKEFGLTLPFMALAGDLLLHWPALRANWRRALAPYAGWVVLGIVYFECRRAAFGPAGAGAGWPDLRSVAFWHDLGQRQLEYLRSLLSQFYFAPFSGNGAYGWSHVVLGGLLAGLIYLGWRARCWAAAFVFFGVGWYALATLPLVVTYVSARHLYLASAGLCVAWALGLGALPRRAGWCLAALLAASFAVALPTATRPWRKAAHLSGVTAAAVREAARQAPPGAALLIDAPELLNGAYVWAWASPFALRPPFQATDLTRERVVLERPQIYLFPEKWADRRPFGPLAREARGAMVVVVRETGETRLWYCPPEKLRPVAERFAAQPPGLHLWALLLQEISPRP
jgi:hypothetical protein